MENSIVIQINVLKTLSLVEFKAWTDVTLNGVRRKLQVEIIVIGLRQRSVSCRIRDNASLQEQFGTDWNEIIQYSYNFKRLKKEVHFIVQFNHRKQKCSIHKKYIDKTCLQSYNCNGKLNCYSDQCPEDAQCRGLLKLGAMTSWMEFAESFEWR